MQYKKSEYRPDKIPQGPGVYIFRNQLKEVIYVGKAKSLRKRMANYFQAARSKTANPKLRSLIQTIAFYEFRQVKTEAESLILESKLIKEFTPRFNTLMRDDKRYPMLKIDLSENFPRLQLARVKKDDGCKYLGPFPETGALKATLDYLSRYFNLRTCSPREPDEEDYAHCHDDLIRHCSAPCMKRISKQDYQAKIKELISVIGGTTSALQSKLKEEMTKEAANMNFEKAAILRDVIHNLDSVFQVKNRNFTNTSHQNYPGEAGGVSLQKHLKMDKPPEHIECFDISNIMGTFTVA